MWRNYQSKVKATIQDPGNETFYLTYSGTWNSSVYQSELELGKPECPLLTYSKKKKKEMSTQVNQDFQVQTTELTLAS